MNFNPLYHSPPWKPWDGKDHSRVHDGMVMIRMITKITHFGLIDDKPIMLAGMPYVLPSPEPIKFDPPLEVEPGYIQVIQREKDGPIEIWQEGKQLWPRG